MYYAYRAPSPRVSINISKELSCITELYHEYRLQSEPNSQRKNLQTARMKTLYCTIHVMMKTQYYYLLIISTMTFKLPWKPSIQSNLNGTTVDNTGIYHSLTQPFYHHRYNSYNSHHRYNSYMNRLNYCYL